MVFIVSRLSHEKLLLSTLGPARTGRVGTSSRVGFLGCSRAGTRKKTLWSKASYLGETTNAPLYLKGLAPDLAKIFFLCASRWHKLEYGTSIVITKIPDTRREEATDEVTEEEQEEEEEAKEMP